MDYSLNSNVSPNRGFTQQFETNLSGINTPTSTFREGSDGLLMKRRETVSDFKFQNRGKYTDSIRKNHQSNSTAVQGDLTFRLTDENLICKTHFMNRNIFLFEDYTDIQPYFTKFARVCQNCESEIKEIRDGSANTGLYDMVIRKNKSKIREIRENRTNSDSANYEIISRTSNFLQESVYPVGDEWFAILESFETNVAEKFYDEVEVGKEMKELKEFILQMDLDPKGDPKLDGIGQNKEKEREYISLAIFLLYFQGSTKVSYNGISDSLKNHLLSMIRLRKVIVRKITEWLRLLIGDFYDFIFTKEGLEVDNGFRNALNIEYPSEEELMKLKFYYEQIIKQKDEQISGLLGEREKLFRDNQDLSNQVEEFKRIINQMKAEFESTIRTKLESLRFEFEGKLNSVNAELSRWKIDFADLEARYKLLLAERDQLRQSSANKTELEARLAKVVAELEAWRNRFADLENRYKSTLAERDQLASQLQALSLKYEAALREIESLKLSVNNYMNQLNQSKQEVANLFNKVDGLTTENKQLRGEVNNLNNTLKNVTDERDHIRSELLNLVGEVEKYKSENAMLLNIKVSHEAQLAEFKNRYDELLAAFNTLKETLERLETENNELKNKKQETTFVQVPVHHVQYVAPIVQQVVRSVVQPVMRTVQNFQPLVHSVVNVQPMMQSVRNVQPMMNTVQNLQPVMNTVQNLQPMMNTVQNLQPMMNTVQNLQPMMQTLSQVDNVQNYSIQQVHNFDNVQNHNFTNSNQHHCLNSNSQLHGLSPMSSVQNVQYCQNSSC